VKWNRAACPFAVALAECLCDQRTGWTRRLTFLGLPVEAILFTFITQQFLGVL
jgi:hypothetical protein